METRSPDGKDHSIAPQGKQTRLREQLGLKGEPVDPDEKHGWEHGLWVLRRHQGR